MVDLHRHDEFSTFDGFGKAEELAKLAKELGHTSLSTTNHGNTNGLIQTYMACKKEGIKAILGVEGYFLPKYKEQTRGYHLILVAKNLEGYGNLNRIQYEGEKQKYYNPIWDFELLEKYHEGLICTTACVAGYLAQCIIADDLNKARKFLKKLKSIFKDDLYIEIQPYKVTEKGLQEKVNIESIKLADELGIKCILTSDSHRGRKEDLDTYMKMHEVAGHNSMDIEATYSERYMPTEKEIVDRFILMHSPSTNGNSKWSIDATLKRAKKMVENLEEIEEKCELNYLDDLPLKLPKMENEGNSTKVIVEKVKDGLRRRGKYKKEYIKRCKEELEVIKFHGFEDYFLIVADYVNWAKEKGIAVGPGRGSVCNSIVAYALGITEVDSILFDLDFRRFLRKDKKKFPDIDLDFETARRQEVIEYLCEKYKGHSARICSYGLYKVDNLINDLAKICGLETTGKDVDEELKKYNKSVVAEIKSFIHSMINENGDLNIDALHSSPVTRKYNEEYDDIIKHFEKLFKKVRFIGTHAAGVAITGGNILDYVALKIDKNGDIYTNYDLTDVEQINVIKFDILGLKTMQSIRELREATGVTVNYDEIVKDKKIMDSFRNGNCDGIFQLEKNTARNILQEIDCNCFMDIVAATSMNRPGPLKMKMPEMYAHNKKNVYDAMQSKYWEYTKDSYGAIIYQEQLQQICVYIGGMSWEDADKMLKFMKNGEDEARALLEKNKAEGNDFEKKFVKGAIKSGLTKEEAKELFQNMLVYSFVKGHGTGYSLISVEEMFYRVYYPNEYWFAKLKYARDDAEYNKFCERAVANDSVIFLPHVNYSGVHTRLRKTEGERIIQQGLSDLKSVGEKAAQTILEERKKNGVFISFDDFYDRCKGRTVTKKVIEVLKEHGALEFNKKTYIKRVKKYNSSLYMRGMR